jgi:chromate reductase
MNENTPIKILAISGSLRSASSNTCVLRAIANMAPQNIAITIYDGLDSLPFFSPERDIENAHSSVTDLRKQIQNSHAVIVCTPEYAFGVPGALKNALDWTVSSGDFSRKPLALISASPLATGADKAHTALLLTFKALDAITNEATKLIIPTIYKKLDGNRITDEETKQKLSDLIYGLIGLIKEKSTISTE